PATSRSSATASAPASGLGSTRFSRWTGMSASYTMCPSSDSHLMPVYNCERLLVSIAFAQPTVASILERALEGERIDEDDAVALLRSRDLVAVGRVANELRNRKTDPDRVTFIIDRNINYTNVCVMDCDFCAFYRSPGDTREGYLLPKPVIFKKIEETIALGGTGLLMQGGHHPDLGIDYYEDLFSSIKARYKIHLHALSP